MRSIIELVSDDHRMQRLVNAITSAGMADLFGSRGPLTLFAPTDDAFERLWAGRSLIEILHRELLSQVLLYHVVSKRLTAVDLTTIASVVTAEGSSLQMRVDGDTILVNEARVLIAEIVATNGLVHIIDTVLVPGHKNVLC